MTDFTMSDSSGATRISPEQEWWKRNIKGFLLDIYGVALNSGEPEEVIGGSREAIDKLVQEVFAMFPLSPLQKS